MYLPLPAHANHIQSLHAVIVVSVCVPWQSPALYLQPELLYLLQHRGLVVPATTEKTVTDVALPCMHSFKAPNIEIPLSKRQKISITTRLQQQIP